MPARSWLLFARGKKTWRLSAAPYAGGLRVDHAFESPDAKWIAEHEFETADAASEFWQLRQGEWTKAGFRAVEKAPFTHALPFHWIGPLPEDARFWIDNRTVRALQYLSFGVWESSGTIGESFGEVNRWRHFREAATAATFFAQELVRYRDAGYTPIERAEVLALYGRAGEKR